VASKSFCRASKWCSESCGFCAYG